MKRIVRHPLFLLLIALTTARAMAQDAPVQIPDDFKGVKIDEHLGDQIPLDLAFLNERSQRVTLSQFFQNGKPVVLQLGYLQCPKLCDVVSRGFVDSARDITLKAGIDYQFIFVSIDPMETPDLAALKKQSYREEYDRSDAEDGFHFLVGTKKNIDTLADAVGYRFNPVAEGQLATPQFVHPAVLMVLSPHGKITRYLYGVNFPPKTLELSMVEASAGKVGSVTDQAVLLICSYDIVTGKYALVAIKLMRLGGIVTVLVLGASVLWLFKREKRMRLA